jgi:hypothetical protein
MSWSSPPKRASLAEKGVVAQAHEGLEGRLRFNHPSS